MKYRNTQKAIVIVGTRESVPPFGITRDFTEEEAKTVTELRLSIQKGYLVPDDGKGTSTPATSSPRTREWMNAPDTQGGKTIKKMTGTGKVVEYITADDIGVDGIETVSQGDPSIVVALDSRKSIDHIEPGMKASSNASEAFDKVLEEENQDSEFDDEKILAENEPEREEIGDADAEIARDQAQILVGGGRSGAQLQTVQEVVEKDLSTAMHALSDAVKPSDDAEQPSTKASGRVVEFLRQSFAQKKWSISKESDKSFLDEIGVSTQSENVKSLVRQRLSELGA